MTRKNLGHIIARTKELVSDNPDVSFDLTLELLSKYGVSRKLEMEVIQNKWTYNETKDKTKKSELINRLLEILDEIPNKFDEEIYLKREKRLAELEDDITLKETDKKIIVEAKNIKKKYPRGKRKFEFENIQLKAGEIVGLVGENASGKTTLLRILAGDLSKSEGELDYPQFNTRNWVKIKQQISYVPQYLEDWQGTLRENIAFNAAIHGLKGTQNEEAVNRIIHLLGLGTHIHKNWKELSGGYRLRFELAKALVWQPELLILDEPLAHLDVKAQITVLEDLKRLATHPTEPIAIILSSQHIHEVEYVAERILFMRGGTLEREQHSDEEVKYPSVFELSCNIDELSLQLLLNDLPGIEIQNLGMYYVISSKKEISTNELLEKIMAHKIEIEYFRNISHSVKTNFYQKREQNTKNSRKG